MRSPTLFFVYNSQDDDKLLGHCECGCDRVGEVSASYVMNFKGIIKISSFLLLTRLELH